MLKTKNKTQPDANYLLKRKIRKGLTPKANQTLSVLSRGPRATLSYQNITHSVQYLEEFLAQKQFYIAK